MQSKKYGPRLTGRALLVLVIILHISSSCAHYNGTDFVKMSFARLYFHVTLHYSSSSNKPYYQYPLSSVGGMERLRSVMASAMGEFSPNCSSMTGHLLCGSNV